MKSTLTWLSCGQRLLSSCGTVVVAVAVEFVAQITGCIHPCISVYNDDHPYDLVNITAAFSEIASVVSNILGTGGNIAGSGAEALGGIGTLYQLAQTALQLTGTGVGILNQASEGKWFSDLTNNIVSNQREIQDRLLAKGASPDELASGSLLSNKITGGFPASNYNRPRPESGEEISVKELGQLGENFKPPDPEDYEELKNPDPESLIRIDKHALEIPTSSPVPTTESEPHTLFPDEETINQQKKDKKLVESFGQPLTLRLEPVAIAADDYYTDVKSELYSEFDTDSSSISNVEEIDVDEKKSKKNVTSSSQGNKNDEVPTDVKEVVELIRKGDLNNQQIAEVLSELLKDKSKSNKAVEKSTNQLSRQTPPKPPKKVVPTTAATPSAHHKQHKATDTDDSDLLYHAKILKQVDRAPTTINQKIDEDENLKSLERSTVSPTKRVTKYPRRTMPPPGARGTGKPKQTSKPKTNSDNLAMPKFNSGFPAVPQSLNMFTIATPPPWTTKFWTPPTLPTLATLPTPAPNLFTLQPNVFQPKLPSTNNLLSAKSFTPVSVSQSLKPATNVMSIPPQNNYIPQQYPLFQQPNTGYYWVPQPYTYGQTIQQYAPSVLQSQPTVWNRPFRTVK
uniref:PAM2 domain-containing protein n=1 Tax=Syphacia muris TaxID=451379 RepID=A0A0N5AIX1_9BILA